MSVQFKIFELGTHHDYSSEISALNIICKYYEKTHVCWLSTQPEIIIHILKEEEKPKQIAYFIIKNKQPLIQVFNFFWQDKTSIF